MSQSSQSINYEDASETFDLKLNDSFNLNCFPKGAEEEYTLEYYNTIDHHALEHRYNIWYSKL